MKKMNLFVLISVGVGSIIGAGIFAMLSTGVSLTGRSIGIAVIFSMALMCLQYVRSMFTASMFKLDGGMYAQMALILGPVLAGCGAFMNLISALSYSVFGISIANYVTQLIPGLSSYKKILALIILTVFFLPLVVAIIHIAVAFKVITKLLAVMFVP